MKKNYIVIISILILFCLYGCNERKIWDPTIELAEGKHVLDIERFLDCDGITFAIHLNWKDVVAAGVLDDLYIMIDKIGSRVSYSSVESKNTVDEFLGLMSLDIEKDIYNLMAVLQLDDPDEPNVFFIIQGNFEGKHKQIIDAISPLMFYPLSEKKTFGGLVYHTLYSIEMPVFSFIDDKTFMIALNKESLDWGLNLILPGKEESIEDPVIKDICRLRDKDNTAWILVTEPGEVIKESMQESGLIAFPHLDDIRYICGDSKMNGKNSTESMVFYVSDDKILNETLSFMKKYNEKTSLMESNYPGLQQHSKNMNYNIDKKLKSVSMDTTFDLDVSIKDLVRKLDDMLPMLGSYENIRYR
ncbi:MAG: hypothetical protein JW737_06200 [Acidobacteria bacterium]|nr:hypothetical protein [Acidobacteriota bacterium]